MFLSAYPESFRTGEQFRDALAMAGMPAPRVQPPGEVHALGVTAGATR